MRDRTYEHIRELRPEGQAAAIWLVNAARANGVPLIVVDARRSLEEQQAHVASGASKTLKSKHLVGQAFDVAVAGVNPDSVPNWFWSWLHDLWDSIGGNRRIDWDLVHFDWG